MGLAVLTLLQCTDIMLEGAVQRVRLARLAARLPEEALVTFRTIRGNLRGCLPWQEKALIQRSIGSLCICNQSSFFRYLCMRE